MTELGKSAKKMGHEHPRVMRRIDRVPARATPAKVNKKAAVKPFGFSYEERFFRDPWKRRYQWFETERAASQALHAFAHKHGKQEWYRDLRAEKRANSTTGDS